MPNQFEEGKVVSLDAEIWLLFDALSRVSGNALVYPMNVDYVVGQLDRMEMQLAKAKGRLVDVFYAESKKQPAEPETLPKKGVKDDPKTPSR